MSQVGWLLPPLRVKDVPGPPKPKKLVRRGPLADASYHRRKYDHAQMVADRLAGMSWQQIAIKHNVVGSVAQLVMNSAYVKRLPPETVTRLGVGVRDASSLPKPSPDDVVIGSKIEVTP